MIARTGVERPQRHVARGRGIGRHGARHAALAIQALRGGHACGAELGGRRQAVCIGIHPHNVTAGLK